MVTKMLVNFAYLEGKNQTIPWAQKTTYFSYQTIFNQS